MRIKAWGYDSEWKWRDLVPLKGMLDHFKRKEDTQLSLEYTKLLNTIPDFILLIPYNAGWVIGLAYGVGRLRRFIYSP